MHCCFIIDKMSSRAGWNSSRAVVCRSLFLYYVNNTTQARQIIQLGRFFQNTVSCHLTTCSS